MREDQVPNIVMFVVIIAESLGISAQTVSKEGGNRAGVRLRLLPKLRTIINEHLLDLDRKEHIIVAYEVTIVLNH